MSFPNLQYLPWCILAFVVLSLTYLYILLLPVDIRRRIVGFKLRLPPGPKGIPLFGNLFQFTSSRDGKQLVQYLSSLRRFGDMVTLHMGSQTWILLNSEHVASDILGKNGRVTGERPHMPVASGIVSEGLRNSLRSTAAWTEGRRVMHQLTSGSILRMYGDWHEVSSLKLLKSYLTEPKLWYTHHYRYSMDVLYRVSMGEELKKPKAELDAFQRLSMEFVWSLNRSIVDFFPLLDRLPYQPWRPYWEAMAKDHRSILEAWYRPVEISLERGIAGPSYIRDTLLHPDTKYSGSRDEAMYIVTSVMAAGSDNTRMVLIVFIMAMISYPSIQARARADIDAVCAPPGSALRLPGLDDMLKLPLISALVKEVIRWRPTVPLVPPHQLTEDLEYNGYTFPKGVCFVVNSVAVSRNIDPGDVFNPDRWLDGNEANILHGMNTFGGGRRICVGYRVAQQALWIAIARLLACFDFTANGEVDTNKLNLQSLSEPFPVTIKIRSDKHRALILEEANRAGVDKDK